MSHDIDNDLAYVFVLASCIIASCVISGCVTENNFKIEAVKHKAAKFIANEDGSVKFVWNDQAEKDNNSK
jgi:hypothetical protein